MKTSAKTLTVKEIYKASAKFVGNESVNLVLADGTTFGVTAKTVTTLPETGENGILYLVKKAETAEGNLFDEYLWVMKEDGTFGFEKVGATDVAVTLYDGLGQNTDGAMTQKAVTDIIGNLEATLHALNNGEES